MDVECPKCNSKKILRRKAVPRFETHRKRFIKGELREVQVDTPRFYVCCKCWHKFNIQ